MVKLSTKGISIYMKKFPQVSLVVTVFNEASSMLKLLEAVAGQTILPSEVIINDAQSSDQTVQIIRD